VNPVSLRLINTLWPANSLTGPATQENFISTANNTSDSYNGIVKLDHIFNEKNKSAAQLLPQQRHRFLPGQLDSSLGSHSELRGELDFSKSSV
jgi:hypothetical protein